MANRERLIKKLRAALGTDCVALNGPVVESASPDKSGWRPEVVVSPRHPSQVAEVVALAKEEKAGLIPRGRGNAMSLGRPPARADVIVDLSLLDQVLEHDPPNLVAVCQAGTTLATLSRVASQADQLFPLDPPLAPRRTVGGVVATDASGPFRLGYGAARDLLLGIKAVTGLADTVKFGGKLIKDVAGFNLAKLFVGSLGTLGVITEVSLKLSFLPEARQTVWAQFQEISSASECLKRVNYAPLWPKACELLSAEAAALFPDGRGPALVVAFAGIQEEVARQVKDFKKLVQEFKAICLDTFSGEKESKTWEAIRDLPATLAQKDDGALLKISGLVSEVGSNIGLLCRLATEAGLDSVAWSHGACGLVYLWAQGQDQGRLAELVKKVRQILPSKATAVVESAPLAVRKEVCPWGPPPASFKMMENIKEALDPEGIMNPGRYVGGI